MRVLIADDDAQMRGWLLRATAFLGHDAEAVVDGQALLLRAAVFEPDVVLSDIGMPGLNGIAAGLRLRKLRPRCRIVLMSGDRGRVEEALKAGFSRVLGKPFVLAQLAAALRADGPREER